MCTLMALGSSGRVGGATLGRVRVAIEGNRSPKVDHAVFVASERAATAVL